VQGTSGVNVKFQSVAMTNGTGGETWTTPDLSTKLDTGDCGAVAPTSGGVNVVANLDFNNVNPDATGTYNFVETVNFVNTQSFVSASCNTT
jgi:hypothetical protein